MEAPHSDATKRIEDLARQICFGLDTDTMMNPRRMKRFLNNFAVRQSIAHARGIRLSAAATAKLMLLEERFLEQDFRILASTPAPDLRDLLRRWEAWGHGRADVAKPDGVSDGSRAWAASAPSLADTEENIAAYLTLAAALTASASGGPLSGKVARFVDDVIATKDSDVLRQRLIQDGLTAFDEAELEQVISAIAGRASTIEPPALAARLVLEIIEAHPVSAVVGCRIIDQRLAGTIEFGLAGKLATSRVPQIQQLATKFMKDERVDTTARSAIARSFGVGSRR